MTLSWGQIVRIAGGKLRKHDEIAFGVGQVFCRWGKWTLLTRTGARGLPHCGFTSIP